MNLALARRNTRKPGSGVLDPLTQRLFLYGFAYVHMDHRAVPGHCLRQLPDLQLLPPAKERPAWEKLLNFCAPFSHATAGPVISPSLHALQQVRRRHPFRPIIFCRTAFERHPPVNQLRPLLGPGKPELPLEDSDPFRPLYLIGRWPRARLELFEPYQAFRPHPLERWRLRAARRNPDSRQFLQEDGILAEQGNLFKPPKPLKVPRCLARARRLFEERFRQQLAGLRGGCYVLARDPELLAWFRRDFVRVLDQRFFCWAFPSLPDPRDPLKHLVLIADRDLKFSKLPTRFTSLHLDGDEQDLRFRAYRLGTQNGSRPHWHNAIRPRAVAYHAYKDITLTFHRTGPGWFCFDGEASGPDESHLFAGRVAGLRELAA